MTPLLSRRQNTAINYYTHHLTGPTYTIHHRGTKPRRSLTFPGHFGFPRSQQHSSHHSLPKAYTYQAIPTLGQQPFHYSKNSVSNTLAFGDQVVCTNQQTLHKVMEHISKALLACNFPPWALNLLQNKLNHKHNTHSGQTTTGNQPNSNNNNGSNSKPSQLQYHSSKDLGKGSKGHATTWGSRCISKGLHH